MTDMFKDKTVLVTGVTGQVGRALVQSLDGRCQLITAARHGADFDLGPADFDLDLASTEQIVAVMDSVKPDIVINAAAYTQVDQAEDEPEIARAINAVAPGVLAEQCKKIDAILIHYSTDYVFAGDGDKPLTEADPVSPINEYGKTKLEGERAIQAVNCDHLIFRTCWVYDAQGKNFLNTIINLAKTREELQVVNDQFGTPTSAQLIAEITSQIIEQCCGKSDLPRQNTNRIYNLTASGFTSWFGFAQEIINNIKSRDELCVQKITPVSTDKFPTKAKRPSWSVLSTQKITTDFDLEISMWDALLGQCIENKFAPERHQ
jgi:dTDP-4-dehydrorhamnose reductase